MQTKPITTNETFLIAKTWKRIIARIFDIIFVSLLPLILGLVVYYATNKNQDVWWTLVLIFIINIITVIIYFVVIPWKCHGQTLGKFILRIRLVTTKNQDLKLKQILLRELFLIFIPLLLTTSIILFLTLTFHENIAMINTNSTLNSWLNILVRSIVSFDFAWYCGIMIVTKIDKYHQLFFDRYHQTFVVNNRPLAKGKKPIVTSNNQPHVHLAYSQPGNINDDELENINSL